MANMKKVRKTDDVRTVVRPVKLNQEEDRFLRTIAQERSTSISSVIRWAIFTAVRQEAERLERVNKSPVADILDTEEAQL